jgi:hypothetical protein
MVKILFGSVYSSVALYNVVDNFSSLKKTEDRTWHCSDSCDTLLGSDLFFKAKERNIENMKAQATERTTHSDQELSLSFPL